MKKPDKRDEIVRATLELIAEHGFHGAPMAMIAEKAGVAAGTIYLYFENKDVLITEVYRDLEERIYRYVQEGYAPEKPIRELVRVRPVRMRKKLDVSRLLRETRGKP